MNYPAYTQIIDAHTHIYPEKVALKAVEAVNSFYAFAIDGKESGLGTAPDLLASGISAGISHFLISSTATKPDQVSSINDFIANTCSDPRFIGFGTLHPEFPNLQAEMERIFIKGLKGIKLHTP